jgi:hypothetical protein
LKTDYYAKGIHGYKIISKSLKILSKSMMVTMMMMMIMIMIMNKLETPKKNVKREYFSDIFAQK